MHAVNIQEQDDIDFECSDAGLLSMRRGAV